MADIRLVRARGGRIWIWVGVLVAASLVVLAFSVFFGDPTEAARTRRVGARANFGADRAPVIPVVVTPFRTITSLGERDVGRLVHLEGWAETPVRRNAVWVRSTDGRRILVRFEPPPEGPVRIYAGGRVSVDGYLQKIARAELKVTLDSMGVRLPRPRPTAAEKFGELPDSGFIRVDSLFVKNFYLSVRPEALAARRPEGGR